MEGLSQTQTNHLRHLKEFVQAQVQGYKANTDWDIKLNIDWDMKLVQAGILNRYRQGYKINIDRDIKKI